MKNNKKGFTLIELLIVIALLGALAVGLLAALDPFEQLKKGTDTGTRNIVSEMHGAIIRYYGIKSHMPWCPTGTGCPADPSGTDLVTTPISTAITNIVAAGELKSDFVTLAGGNTTKVFVTGSEANATAIACFRPTAKSFLADANSKYNKLGVVTACVTTDLATCFWCVQ
ncbi:prepilin-type N-terminal cleavage/methylation domain-containing protein [Candidatus Roizmanbacteria bacterium]|nr:prepilin-type N-terminal cleavage/methylation domain-containing protein [Candidatus Roizmanbacteria bacterium]